MKPLRLLLAAVLATVPLAAAAGDDAGSTTSDVVVGGWGTTQTGSPVAVSEYEPTDGQPLFGATVVSHQDWGSLFLDAIGYHSDDIDGTFDFDVSRAVRSHTSYSKLLHRLGHDPMENLEATSTNGKVVIHSDLEPEREYGLSYQLLDHRTEIQFPRLPALTVAVGYRHQKRDGDVQAYTLSHCDTCHITSQGHRLDETTTDAHLEAQVAWKGGFVRGSVTSRELRQGVPNLTLTFDDALHPEQRTPMFDNRLQYDSAEGPLPVDLWPDIDKDISRLDLHFDNLGGFVVNGGGVWSTTRNQYTRLESSYSGYMVNAARRLGRSWNLSWRGRVYTIDSDDVFVDTVERVTPAGPQAGKTYEDIYGRNFDWTRRSTLNRDAIESRLNLSHRLGSLKAGTLKLSWNFESIDRDTYQVAPDETVTTSNVLGISWRSRPAKGFKLDARYHHGDVDHPFMLVNGACSTLVSEAYPNPFNPDSPQYEQFQDARVADTTASPSSWDEIRLAATASLSSATSLTGTYRWWDGSNSDGDLTDWSRTNQTATLTLWGAPSEAWDWYLGYSWIDSQLDAPACIPVFDG
jgi:hypothetical protein